MRTSLLSVLFLLPLMAIGQMQWNPGFQQSEEVESHGSTSPPNILYVKSSLAPTYTTVAANIAVNYGEGFGASERAAFNKAVQIWQEFLLSLRSLVNEDARYTIPTIRINTHFSITSPTTIAVVTTNRVCRFQDRVDPYYFHQLDFSAWYTTVNAKLMVSSQEWDDVENPLKNDPDITIILNQDKSLYYMGLDGAANDKYDLVTVVLRELLRGSGFGSTISRRGNSFSLSRMAVAEPDGTTTSMVGIFDSRLKHNDTRLASCDAAELGRLAQSGNVNFYDGYKMYAPTVFDQGKTLRYLDTETPNCILKPELKRGEAIHVIDGLVKKAFEGLIFCSIIVGNGNSTYTLHNIDASEVETHTLSAIRVGNTINLSLNSSSGVVQPLSQDKVSSIGLVRIDQPAATTIRASEVSPEGSIDISPLPSGIYAIKVVDTSGRCYQDKFIK